jgi:hypothetical protein
MVEAAVLQVFAYRQTFHTVVFEELFDSFVPSLSWQSRLCSYKPSATLALVVLQGQHKRLAQYLTLEPGLVNHVGRQGQPLLHLAILACRDTVRETHRFVKCFCRSS